MLVQALPLGKTFLIKNPPEAVFASYLIRMRTAWKAPTLQEFVYWYFQSPYYDGKQITPRGGAQPNMNAQLLKQVRIPIPIDENAQKQIVSRIATFQDEDANAKSTE